MKKYLLIFLLLIPLFGYSQGRLSGSLNDVNNSSDWMTGRNIQTEYLGKTKDGRSISKCSYRGEETPSFLFNIQIISDKNTSYPCPKYVEFDITKNIWREK